MITKFNPHITYNGNCEMAFDFYKSIFGGDYTKLIRYNEMQGEEGAPSLPEEVGNQIRHIELPLNAETILIGSDNAENNIQDLVQGTNIKISITTEEEPEGKRLFDELSVDGIVKVPFGKSFWGSDYGSLIDKFGIHWMIEVPKNTDHGQLEDNSNIHIP